MPNFLLVFFQKMHTFNGFPIDIKGKVTSWLEIETATEFVPEKYANVGF